MESKPLPRYIEAQRGSPTLEKKQSKCPCLYCGWLVAIVSLGSKFFISVAGSYYVTSVKKHVWTLWTNWSWLKAASLPGAHLGMGQPSLGQQHSLS